MTRERERSSPSWSRRCVQHAPAALDRAFADDWAAAGDDAARLRVVVDQVASLTDASAVTWHDRLVRQGPRPGLGVARLSRWSGCRSTRPSWATRPAELRYEMVDPTESVPDSVGEVEVYVPPYAVGSEGRRRDPADDLAALRPDPHRGRRQHPAARFPTGSRCAAVAASTTPRPPSWSLTLVLASLRGVPSFVRAQDRHEWTPGWHPALADATVLLVGYGAIGAAVEARLAPFECSVVRVARSARDGVHADLRAARAAALGGRRRARAAADRRDPGAGRRRRSWRR